MENRSYIQLFIRDAEGGYFQNEILKNRWLCLDYIHLQKKILLICPQWPEIFFGKFHDSMEPVPKSETSIR